MSVFDGCVLAKQSFKLPNGNTISIREMSGRDRDDFDRVLFRMANGNGKQKKPQNQNIDPVELRNELLCRTLYDEKNESPLFKDKVDAQAQLGNLPSMLIQKLFEESSKVNGLGVTEEQMKADLDAFPMASGGSGM